MNRIRMEPFIAREMQYDERISRVSERAFLRARKRKRFEPRTGSMTAKISLCMAVLACVILAEALLLDVPWKPTSAVSVTQARQSAAETDEDEALGRLRFVEAGGVKSVFAVSQRWDMPVAAKEARSIEDETMLFMRAAAGEKVLLSASGEVRVIGEDETLGAYVRINHGSGLESVYYHLADVCVEEGQPLVHKDVLGRVHEDGTLYFAITRDGAPLNPESYLNTDSLKRS